MLQAVENQSTEELEGIKILYYAVKKKKKRCWCKWEESQIKPSYLKSAANNDLTAPKLKNPTLTFGYLIQRPTQIIRPIN